VIKLQSIFLTACLLLTGLAAGEEMPATPGDRLNVTVTNEMDLSGNYAVDQDGNIFLPMVGKVTVKGLSAEKVRDELEKRLRKFVREPQVSVEFLERAQITVGFTGMVGKPGPVKVKKGSRLLDGIAEAGGFTPDLADTENIVIQRRGEAKPRKIDYNRLVSQGDAAQNVELKDGDSVIVPRIPMNLIRVLGAVNKPGDVQRKAVEPLTVLEAVLAGGGPAPDADLVGKVQVLRRGAAQPELLSYEALRTGAIPNPFLKDGDTVTVPSFPKVAAKVFGQVMKPGVTEMREGTTVIEAIAAAGGFIMDSDQRAVFIMNEAGDVRRLDLAKLDSPDVAVVLKPGDRVFVPQATPRRFAVAGGGVPTPGVYPFPADPAQKLSLAEALSQGGGITDRAKKKTGVLVRKDPAGGKPTVIPLDLEGLFVKKNAQANIEVMVNDVIYVDAEPERDRKPSALERILSIAGGFFGGF
jgi:polysaccharide biosynthesis/export protein